MPRVIKGKGWRALARAAVGLALIAATAPPDYHAAALRLDDLITAQYAYLEKLPGGSLPSSAVLTAERDAVADGKSLRRYAEDRIASLADHHANTGSSFADSWALVPTYSDLWVVQDRGGFVIAAVRDASPAADGGVKAGDQLVKRSAMPRWRMP